MPRTARRYDFFSGWRGHVTYVGQFALDRHEPHYVAFGKGRDGLHRRVIVFRLRPVGFEGPDVRLPVGPLDEGLVDGSRTLHGQAYREAAEDTSTRQDREPFSVDPNEQDRALRAHATAQNVLASWVTSMGCEPLSPTPEDPSFDLAWRRAERIFVAEVKSVLPVNEVRQLRLGLGQVLDYAQQLDAVPVLFVDRRLTSDRWVDIAARAGVRLAWPADFTSLRMLDR